MDERKSYGCLQQSVESLGTIPKPITAAGPATVPGVDQLTQSLNGNQTTRGAAYRGYFYTPPVGSVNDDGDAVEVAPFSAPQSMLLISRPRSMSHLSLHATPSVTTGNL